MKTAYPTPACATLLPSDPSWLKKFNAAIGDPDMKAQAQLAKSMQLNCCSGVGEVIWAMIRCRPDLAFDSIKLLQSNSCPQKLHYRAKKHALEFLYASQDDGLYFWCTSPWLELPEGPLSPVRSNKHDILLEHWPQFDANIANAYSNSDWATCVKTRRSFSSICICFAGGTIAYKCKFQPTFAGCLLRLNLWLPMTPVRWYFFVRSVLCLWDLSIPQEATTLLYEDNDRFITMGNAQKLTPQTCHINIKYFSLCEWVEHNLILLDWIDTSINMSNHLTKSSCHLSSINMLISSSDMSLQVTRQFIPLLLGHTPITPLILRNLSLRLSLPHLQPLLLESMHHLR